VGAGEGAGAFGVLTKIQDARSAIAPAAKAQQNMDTFACQYIGRGPSEPLRDRDGHALRLAQFSCLASAGPLSGGVLTGARLV
jgi:hypothetical protein